MRADAVVTTGSGSLPKPRRGASAALALVVGLLFAFATPAAAQSDVRFSAAINGVPVDRTSDSSALALEPKRPAELSITVVNGRASPLEVRTVRLEGRVLGLTFFAYDTSVAMQVAPGATESRRLVLDLRGLEGQATGLMPAFVKLLDRDRREVAGQSLTADVRGSLRSLYGFFGLIVALLTVLSFTSALVALARNRLPVNRWRRGLRFAPTGVGVGLIAVFTLSALRFWAPRSGRVLVVLAVVAAASFLLGYLTPTPEERERELLEDSPSPSGWTQGPP